MDQPEASPLPGRRESMISRYCSSDEVRKKLGGIGTCHLTLIILVAVLQLCGWQ